MKKFFLIMVAIIGFGVSANAQYKYYISTGRFVFSDGSSTTGHSGAKGEYRNKSQYTDVKGGPIPVGTYYITNVKNDLNGSYHLNVIVLSPDSGNNMYGRYDFRIHGDNTDSTASQGCIILSREHRQKIADDFDKNGRRTLTVYE